MMCREPNLNKFNNLWFIGSSLANFCGEIPNGSRAPDESRQCKFCTGRGRLTGCAPLGPHLGHFQVSKLRKSRIFGKVCESTFQPNWNFGIWWSFSRPKLHSPKTAFCVSKMWQKVIFCLFFDFLEAQNFIKSFVHG